MKQELRNLLVRLLPNTFTDAQWVWLLEQTDYRCIYCGQRSDILIKEHVLPVQQGGPTTIDNLRPACYSCNNLKGNQTPEQAGMPLLWLHENRIQSNWEAAPKGNEERENRPTRKHRPVRRRGEIFTCKLDGCSETFTKTNQVFCGRDHKNQYHNAKLRRMR